MNTPDKAKQEADRLIERLLIPRIEVIGLWPGCECSIGDIIIPPDDNWKYNKYEYCDVKYFQAWPNLFREMKWHEKREVSEMPGWIRLIHPKLVQDKVYDKFMEVKEWRQYKDCEPAAVVGEYLVGAQYVQPSTLQEYEQYKSNNK